MWMVFALLSAVFAALTSILDKIEIDGVNSNLATTTRTPVMVIMAWSTVFLIYTQSGITKRMTQYIDIFDIFHGRMRNESLKGLISVGF